MHNLTTTEAFTIKAESEIINQLDYMARSLDRTRNYIVNQAIREYLQTHTWQLEKINQGIAAAEQGELLSHAKFMQKIEALIEQKVKNKL
jgi:predicted transcriptional regulator